MTSERLQRQIERLLNEADEALTSRKWTTVRDRAQDALAIDPDNREAQGFLDAASRALAAGADRAVEDSPVTSPPSTSSLTAQPTSFASGRYEVKRFLGEGGKKKVYLAHDGLLDRDVAFALIKTEGLDDAARERVSREAQAMGRLGSHPHIVTVFDIGEQNRQPYLVLPLLPGGDIEGLIEKAEGHRLPIEQAVKLAIDTCQGLEFAHSKGIIHRDLKPGNVWLAEDGRAMIGDFGLAVAMDRSRLTQAGMMVGTVSYMPPEQAMGGEVTPRSDLYSLGAMLYEMVCGRPPFLGQDSVAIIGQHLHTQPVAPSWHNPGCPRPLEALILRLLAKDPKERPQSARDVLQTLQAIDLEAAGQQGEAGSADANALDSLAGGVFVGRQREMGELKAALEDALSGRGRLVMLVGEPGIGKTRISQELSTYSGLRQCQVLWGRCYEGSGAPPYWPWVQAVRDYVREIDAPRLRSEMGAGAADVAEIISDVRERLPDLLPGPVLEPEQARFRLFDSLTTFLRSASRHQPIVLFLEDLHWADTPSLLLLEFLSRELGQSRLLVVGTYRDVDVSRQHPLAQTLGELTKERLFQRILLRGLSQADVGRFIELTTGAAPPEALVEAIFGQTEGNPLFVVEVVRLLVQEGQLPVDATSLRQSWTVHIPEGVREVIGRRLNRLSERCNQVLTIAAVIGREFSLDQLASLVEDTPREHLLDVLEEALAAHLIEELPRSAGRYQFTHALMGETLAGELSITRRVQLHARIATALERLYGSQSDVHAAELAYHFGEAETLLGPDRFVHFVLVAGENALASYAFEEALGLLQRGIKAKEGSPPDDETANLLFALGRAEAATLPLDRLSQAVSTLGRAFDYYARVGNIARAIAVAEQPFPPVAGHATGAPQLLARALALVPAGSHESSRLLAPYGRLLGVEEGDYEGAAVALTNALDIARREGDGELEMRTLSNFAEVEGYHGHFVTARQYSLQALEMASRTNNPQAEVTAGLWIALHALSEGQVDAAESAAKSMLAAAERARHHFYLARALSVHSYLYVSLGQWERVRDVVRRTLAISPREPRVLVVNAIAEYLTGDFATGGAYLSRLVDLVQASPPGPTLERTFFVMALALAHRVTEVPEWVASARDAGNAILDASSATNAVRYFAQAGLGLLASQNADLAEARRLYDGYTSELGDNVTVVFTMAAPHVRALLAVTMGRPDLAVGHFEDAIAFSEKAGYLPDLAWTCCDYADLLSQSDQPVDSAKAASLLDRALRLATDLEMRPLIERIVARRELLKA